jgi:hypothetical protein
MKETHVLMHFIVPKMSHLEFGIQVHEMRKHKQIGIKNGFGPLIM